jgi:RES domain-containing protein
MNCCPRCFNHKWVKEQVTSKATHRGDCDYCVATNVPLVNVAALCGAFSNLLDMYAPLENDVNVKLFRESSPIDHGSPLVDLIQEDWDVLSDAVIGNDRASALIEDIVNSDWDDDSGESPVDADDLWTRNDSLWHESLSEKWADFRARVLAHPDLEPDFHELFGEDIACTEVAIPQGYAFFRARIGFATDQDGRRTPYGGSEIEAPPPEKCGSSRAAPEGKRVLYCASSERTAIAEIRPQRGLIVSVATMRSTRELRVLDLCKRRPPLNPFLEGSLRYELELREVLRDFSQELATPLRRTDNPADYLPSQKVSAFIEQAGYDGIIYGSAMAPSGTNVVLFDPGAATPIDSKLVEVKQFSVRYEEYDGEE